MTRRPSNLQIGRVLPLTLSTMRCLGTLLVAGAVLLQCRAQSGPRRRIEVERIRRRILGEMGDGAEEARAPTPRDSALDVLLRSAEHTQIMILPEPGASECVPSPCWRFEYNVSSSILPWTARWMVDKSGLDTPANLTISASCSSEERVRLEVEGEQDHWLLYRFPATKHAEWTSRCHVQIEGAWEVPGPLLTAGRVQERRARRVRQVASSSECGVVPFRISFAEMGLEKWIVHPVSFDARFCEGACDEQRGYHEYLLGQLLGREESQGGRCWATCCRPIRYGPIHLIHHEEDNTYALRVMDNMIVEECACS